MPTTPVIPNGLVRFKYTAAGLAHVLNVRVKVAEALVVGEEPDILAQSGSGANRSASDFVTYAWGKIKEMYLPADTLDSYEVYSVAFDPPLFVFGQSATIVGTHTGEQHQTAEGGNVLTFRDVASKKVKFNFFGSVDARLTRITNPAGGIFPAFIADMVSTTPTGKLQDYIFGRAGVPMMGFMSVCGGANNALEKKILFG